MSAFLRFFEVVTGAAKHNLFLMLEIVVEHFSEIENFGFAVHDELAALKETIADLKNIIANPHRVEEIVKTELNEIKEKCNFHKVSDCRSRFLSRCHVKRRWGWGNRSTQ